MNRVAHFALQKRIETTLEIEFRHVVEGRRLGFLTTYVNLNPFLSILSFSIAVHVKISTDCRLGKLFAKLSFEPSLKIGRMMTGIDFHVLNERRRFGVRQLGHSTASYDVDVDATRVRVQLTKIVHGRSCQTESLARLGNRIVEQLPQNYDFPADLSWSSSSHR